MSRIKFLNTEIDNITMNEAITTIDSYVNDGKYHYIVAVNVNCIVKLENDKESREIFKNADLILADGMPLIWISKLMDIKINEKISGSDLFPKICDLASRKNYKLFLLGAAAGVAEKAAHNLLVKYRGICSIDVYSPSYGFEKNLDEVNHIIRIINDARPDILAVGLGAPKQEKFIYKYLEQLKVPLSIAVGATIDFEAGQIKRAPKWMQKNGLEWLYRTIIEPKRLFKRYFMDAIRILPIIFRR